MANSGTIPIHVSSSQSDIDEIETLIHSGPTSVLPARPQLPSPFIPSSLPPLPQQNYQKSPPLPPATVPVVSADPDPNPIRQQGIGSDAFGSAPNTLTEPVWETVKRDLARIISNLKLVVFPNPFREDPGKALRDWDLWGPFFFIVFLGLTLSWSASVKKGGSGKGALRDWDLWGPFFFIVFLGLTLSWSASVKKSEVFAVAFAVLAAGAIILTLNVLLLGGHIIFFQSLSLLGYCLFPLDVGALICLLIDNAIVRLVVVSITLGWSSWAAYPFMSAAVNPRRKALALYPVFLMYISVCFLIIAID